MGSGVQDKVQHQGRIGRRLGRTRPWQKQSHNRGGVGEVVVRRLACCSEMSRLDAVRRGRGLSATAGC